jgi:ribonuclease PH
MVENELLLDLDYSEDSKAQVDMNVVVTGKGQLVEVQATGEGCPFSVTKLNSLLKLAIKGTAHLKTIQLGAMTKICAK